MKEGEGMDRRDGAAGEAEPGFEALIHAQEEAELHEPPGDWRVEDWLAFALFWVLATVVFTQFFSRYVLNDSIAWTEEIARYLLMAVAFLGAALAARRGTHIALEIVPNLLPAGLRRWAFLLLNICTVVFFAICAWLCWSIAEAMMYQPMVVIDFPLGWVYWAVLVGMLMTTFRVAQFAWARFRAGEPEKAHDPSEGARL
ncbi:MAG: TRAP transporter small permease [Acetobacteraceae bacterium]|jgi:TRAP-type C4-dicarboxylate transport system permease small subunit|nr:TRAP transporter small permease [Acetobacteraceae bacterium]